MNQAAGKTIYDYFSEQVRQQPAAQAIGSIHLNELHWTTWRELHSLVEAEREQLRSAGVSKRGGVRLPEHNSIAWIVSNLAAWAEGAVTLPHDWDGVTEGFDASLAAIAKTSGTGSAPRFVYLSHENLTSNATAASSVSKPIDEANNDELRLSFLPFSHLYARVCDLYTSIIRGSRLVMVENRETIFRDCQLVKPTVVNGVPYFFQKAIDLAEQQQMSLRELLGGSIRRCYSGGAALSPVIEQRFHDSGIPLLNGYGLTETSPVVTISTPTCHRLGTVGKPLPGVEVQFTEEGELLVRGPNVMLGYGDELGRIDPATTNEVVQEGWLHTGDLGELDQDGFLKITGRKKEVIALSTGKKISPAMVEAKLAASTWFEQVALFGEGEKGLTALIVPNRERLRAEVRRQRLWVWSKRQAVRHAKIRAIYQLEIDQLLKDSPKEHRPHRFVILTRGFQQTRGEITRKLSLRREVIAKSFAKELEG